MSQTPVILNLTRLKLEQLSHPLHVFCRNDVIYLLELIKKKVAEPDPGLMDLTQPQLLQHFYQFADVAMKLINHTPTSYTETQHLKEWIHSIH